MTKTVGAVVIIADGEIDQIVETEALAKRERRDLENNECTVKLKTFATMAEAEAWADVYRGVQF